MRLPQVDTQHSLLQKLQLRVIALISGQPAPDVVKTLMHRRDYLGKGLSPLTQAVLRGPSLWSVAERELFASYVSSLNQCPF
jgi:hypothetical protein